MEKSLYHQVINNLIKSDNPIVIKNEHLSDIEKLILTELIQSAKENIYIFCAHFSKETYKDIQFAIEDAIRREVSVNIAIKDENPQAKDFKEFLNKDGKFRLYTNINKPGLDKDFYVIDNKRFVLGLKDNKAYICFNDSEISERLIGWFNISVTKA